MSCGQWCFIYLGSNGLCQKGLLICLQFGRDLLENIEIFPFGRLCHIASCGSFDESGMQEVLRILNGLSLMLKPSSLILHTLLDWSVAFFSLSTSLGKILITYNLWMRRILVLDWCYMYKRCVGISRSSSASLPYSI